MEFTKSALVAVVLSLAGVATAQVFDLHKDFAREANPHHTWTYGSSKTLTGFDPYTNNKIVEQFYGSKDQGELIGWSRPDSIFPYAARNEGTSVLYQHWNPGDVVLHPSVELFSIARWTNPQPGGTRVHLFVTFRRVENVTDNLSQWYVVVNGKVIDSGTLSLTSEEKSVTETLDVGPGGTISLVVGCKDHQEGTDLSVNARIEKNNFAEHRSH